MNSKWNESIVRGAARVLSVRQVLSGVKHWEHGGRPFCGIKGAKAVVVPAEEDVTCKRCLECIGRQDSPGGGGP